LIRFLKLNIVLFVLPFYRAIDNFSSKINTRKSEKSSSAVVGIKTSSLPSITLAIGYPAESEMVFG